jgi:hypothetical protein
MKRFSVLPFVLFALACADTPTDVAPDDLALAADHHGNKVVLIVSAGARTDVSRALGGGVFPEGTYIGWSLTARQTASGEVSGNLHYNLSEANGGVVDEEVTCLAVIGNRAYVGARILKNRIYNEKNPGAEGTQLIMRLTDNGEGAGAEPDEISDNTFRDALREWAGLPDGTCEDPEIQAAMDPHAADDQVELPVAKDDVPIISRR